MVLRFHQYLAGDLRHRDPDGALPRIAQEFDDARPSRQLEPFLLQLHTNGDRFLDAGDSHGKSGVCRFRQRTLFYDCPP